MLSYKSIPTSGIHYAIKVSQKWGEHGNKTLNMSRVFMVLSDKKYQRRAMEFLDCLTESFVRQKFCQTFGRKILVRKFCQTFQPKINFLLPIDLLMFLLVEILQSKKVPSKN